MNLIVDVGRLTVASLIYVFTLLFLFDDHSKKYKSMSISVEGQQRHQSNSANRQKVPISIWMKGWKKLSALVKMWNLLGLSNLWWTIVSSVGWKNINVVLLYCLDMSVENTCLPKKLKILHKMWVQISD